MVKVETFIKILESAGMYVSDSMHVTKDTATFSFRGMESEGTISLTKKCDNYRVRGNFSFEVVNLLNTALSGAQVCLD